ncbi:unnamed protein product [Pleuronectes platessa]|uniref:Uncharacterized protein n=1 Tax=Pleuronectes platessa TaxID=8262 RepID=A0A9N7Y6D9_PLEPL|nr:unnamed protein product [Pleuronectes platessa]
MVVTLVTDRKWRPANAVEEARTALTHTDIVEHVQLGRGGLCLTTKLQPQDQEGGRWWWRRYTNRRRQQGGSEGWTISWKDLWSIELDMTSFKHQAIFFSGWVKTQDVLSVQGPPPSNTF